MYMYTYLGMIVRIDAKKSLPRSVYDCEIDLACLHKVVAKVM